MFSRKRACGTGSGFTLIELLVVISVIAMLLAILMPSLSRVKEQAKNIVCRTRLRTLSVACNVYAADFESKLFGYFSGLYLNQLSPYTEDIDKSRYCPAVVIKEDYNALGQWGAAKEPWIWRAGTPEPEYGCYALNGWFYTEQPDDWITAPEPAGLWAYENLPQARRAGVTPLFSDAVWVDTWPRHDDLYEDTMDPDHDLLLGRDPTGWYGSDGPVRDHIRRIMINRHNYADNIGFVDGHVDSVKIEKLWSLKWNKLFEPQTDDMTRRDGTPLY